MNGLARTVDEAVARRRVAALPALPALRALRALPAMAAMAALIALAMASRHWPQALPAAFGKYPGNALRAPMAFSRRRAPRPRARARDGALLALGTSVVAEIAKLWQAHRPVEVRCTTIGHQPPSHVFSWQSFVAQGIGALVGIDLDRALLRAGGP